MDASITLAQEVYPRVCGGTHFSISVVRVVGGLSPRVRGNLIEVEAVRYARGSIPACAGEPSLRTVIAPASRVYPRVCGGTFIGRQRSRMSKGLSPRVRGNRTRRWAIIGIAGSIPACAGEPRAHRRADARPEVYPRVCGGTPASGRAPSASAGLSPRVRGNPNRINCAPFRARSIPACAGEP